MDEENIEKIYVKKTQLEHILCRPDTYVGSIQKQEQPMWVFDEQDKKFSYETINYVPGLYKIFDEILVNAADNYQKDRSMNYIKIFINDHEISVENNGKGIPIKIHKEHKIYVPELIFGHLLSGSNFNDNEKKIVGGRNGYGAKLTNAFSKVFTIETADKSTKKKFKKVWRDNMNLSTPAEVIDYSGTDFTKVTFQPDLKRFHMSVLDPQILSLFKKRAYDLAGLFAGRVKVTLNNELLNIKTFQDYVNMYLMREGMPKIYDKAMTNSRWEVCLSFSDGIFQQVSFVNAIATIAGGKHVEYVADQIVKQIKEKIEKKKKNLNVKPGNIKSQLWLFVNCLIENPSFSSQTKETLTTPPKEFGSTCEVTEKFMKELLNSGICELIINQTEAKERSALSRQIKGVKKKRLFGIPKLEDANQAGGKFSDQCTLILTEGDSAKSLAMAGIEVVGRDLYGVFPLRGKMLNVREANNKQIGQNPEVQNLMKIIGLDISKKYTDKKCLRYGQLMIMADQDYDGSHIKGLVINFIHHFWPSLINMNTFVKEFSTPIIKAFKGQDTKTFFAVSDFKQWADTQRNIKNWRVKYYKGLGTSTGKEAQEYFSNLNLHEKEFRWVSQDDDNSIDLAFNKKRSDDRKE